MASAGILVQVGQTQRRGFVAGRAPSPSRGEFSAGTVGVLEAACLSGPHAAFDSDTSVTLIVNDE